MLAEGEARPPGFPALRAPGTIQVHSEQTDDDLLGGWHAIQDSTPLSHLIEISQAFQVRPVGKA